MCNCDDAAGRIRPNLVGGPQGARTINSWFNESAFQHQGSPNAIARGSPASVLGNAQQLFVYRDLQLWLDRRFRAPPTPQGLVYEQLQLPLVRISHERSDDRRCTGFVCMGGPPCPPIREMHTPSHSITQPNPVRTSLGGRSGPPLQFCREKSRLARMGWTARGF